MTKREWKRRYMDGRALRRNLKWLRHECNAEFLRVLKLYPAQDHNDLLADCHD